MLLLASGAYAQDASFNDYRECRDYPAVLVDWIPDGPHTCAELAEAGHCRDPGDAQSMDAAYAHITRAACAATCYRTKFEPTCDGFCGDRDELLKYLDGVQGTRTFAVVDGVDADNSSSASETATRCADDDACLQAKWGSSWTCSGSTRWCTSYAADMACCPVSCDTCPAAEFTPPEQSMRCDEALEFHRLTRSEKTALALAVACGESASMKCMPHHIIRRGAQPSLMHVDDQPGPSSFRATVNEMIAQFRARMAAAEEELNSYRDQLNRDAAVQLSEFHEAATGEIDEKSESLRIRLLRAMDDLYVRANATSSELSRLERLDVGALAY